MECTYNPNYRIGFCGMTLDEKNRIKNALDSRFFEFIDEIELDDNLLNKPDLIIDGEGFISNRVQSILDVSMASLVMVSSKSEEELEGTEIFSLYGEDFDSFINGVVRTAMYQNALKVRFELELCFNENDSIVDKISKLLSFVNEKDPYTFRHSVNVAEYSAMIAEELGYDETIISEIRIGGLLHDIGKICLPNSILFNTTPTLDKNQIDVMQNHPSLGMVILPDELESVYEMILLHHERLDGSGYPFGFEESQLSDMVRIISVADTYDAMTTKRTYQEAMDNDTAFGILYKLSSDGNKPKLDRKMVLALENAINKKKEKVVNKIR